MLINIAVLALIASLILHYFTHPYFLALASSLA